MPLNIENMIRLHKTAIIVEMDAYSQHCIKIDELLKSEVNSFLDKHTKIASNLAEIEKKEYFEYISTDLFNIQERIPLIQRKSEIINAYSLLESCLDRLCKSLYKQLNLALSLDDIAASGYIQKHKKYLEKVVIIDFKPCLPFWLDILSVQEIRNCLVHNRGKVNLKNEKLVKFINDTSGLQLDDEYLKIDNSGFILDSISLFRDFFICLFSQIEKRLQI